MGLTKAHNRMLENARVNVKDFGATGDGVTDDSTTIQAAITASVAAGGVLFFPPGTYSYSTTITIPTEGLRIEGSGMNHTNLSYTGSAEAINYTTAGLEEGMGLMSLSGFTLTGTSTATYGMYIYPVSQHYTAGVIDGVRVTGFMKAGAYALYLRRLYNFKVSNFSTEGNDGGIHISEEVIGCEISQFWLRDCTQKGVEISGGTAFNVAFESGIIDAPYGTPANKTSPDNYGFYQSAGQSTLSNVHFEDLNRPYMVTDGLAVCDRVFFAGGINSNPGATGDSIVFLDNCNLSLAYQFEASVGTSWTNNQMAVLPATYAVAAADVSFTQEFGTVVKVSSATAESISGWNSIPGVRMGDITMLFEDDNITLVNGSSTANGYFVMNETQHWTPHAGDSITFRPIGQTTTPGNHNEFREVSRHFVSLINDKAANFAVGVGDHNRTFTNSGATGTITASMFNTIESNIGTEITFVRESSFALRIDPYTTETIRGGGSGKYMSLDSDGANVTLRLVSLNMWEIISSYGTITYEA
jgi:hypothetical protein